MTTITMKRKFWTQRIREDDKEYVVLICADLPEGWYSWSERERKVWLYEQAPPGIHQFFLNKAGEWQEYVGFDQIDPLRIRISDNPRANLIGTS